MARAVTTQRKTINTVAAWVIGLLIFFPILWTILTSFKTEAQAINDPPLFLFFDWTLENYAVVQERSDYMKFLWNSVIIAGGSTFSASLSPSRRLVDGLCALEAHKGHPFVDAVDQDAAGGGVLYPISLIFISSVCWIRDRTDDRV